MNNQEPSTGNQEGETFQKGIRQLNILNNDMINDISTISVNIDNRNIVIKTGQLFKMLQNLLQSIVAPFIAFMGESHKQFLSNNGKFTKLSQVLGDIDTKFDTINAKMVQMENKMNTMGEQFMPVVKERQRLDARLKENSASMYSGGNKNKTQRRRNVNKKHK
jgi:hypothetical protein